MNIWHRLCESARKNAEGRSLESAFTQTWKMDEERDMDLAPSQHGLAKAV